jgi:hypothetical protein
MNGIELDVKKYPKVHNAVPAMVSNQPIPM